MEATLPQASEDSGLLGISLEVKLPIIGKKPGGPCVCSRMFQNLLFEDYSSAWHQKNKSAPSPLAVSPLVASLLQVST